MQQNKKAIASETLIQLVLVVLVVLTVTFIWQGPVQAAISRGTCEGNQGTCDEKAYVYIDGKYQCNQNEGYLPTTFECKNKIDKKYTPRPCCLFISGEEREQQRIQEDIAEIGSGMEKIAPAPADEIEESEEERENKADDTQDRKALREQAEQLKGDIEATQNKEEQYNKKLALVELYGELNYQRMTVALLEDIALHHPSEESKAVAMYTLAGVYAKQDLYVHDPYLAIETYERFIEKYPAYVPDSDVYLRLFEIAMIDLEDVTMAQQYYEFVQQETPQYAEDADEINRRLSLDDEKEV
ncbi:TPA: hypothetical protein HA249_07345 [Candidatus Woesearchaeota archaeon]|nr:MAG: hypothetical protein QT07_C0007G0029 [archaeon GW2011_AR16]HIG96666.1 hypothetical protein [Candidatus Woesearchaeota archaeon]